MTQENLLEIQDLEVRFPIKKGILQRTTGYVLSLIHISEPTRPY